MSKSAWITLLVVATCAAFALGVTIRRATSGKPETGSRQQTAESEVELAQGDRILVLLAIEEKLRGELTEKEQIVGALETAIAEARAKLPPPLTPEEEKQKQEQEERRKRDERRKALYEKSNELRKKILQRKDKALRQEGLAELAALMQSDDPEDLLLGLTTFSRVSSVISDKESFKPRVLDGITHQDAQIRQAAFTCLYMVYSGEVRLDIMLGMVTDSSPEVRAMVAWPLGRELRGDRKEEVMTAMRSLLRDDDRNVQWQALDVLSHQPEQSREIENLVIKMSKEPENADRMVQWLSRRDTISAEVAQRLVEMYDEGRRGYDGVDWTNRRLSDDARPIASQFCTRILRDGIELYERGRALDSLRRMGDPSVLPELEQIANSPDAEGIEEQLSKTIEYLQQKLKEPR